MLLYLEHLVENILIHKDNYLALWFPHKLPARFFANKQVI